MGIRKKINHKVLEMGGRILLMWVTPGVAKNIGQTSSSEFFGRKRVLRLLHIDSGACQVFS